MLFLTKSLNKSLQQQSVQIFTWKYVNYLSTFITFNSSKYYLQDNLNYDCKTNKKFHTANNHRQILHKDTENRHVYGIMQSLPIYKNSLTPLLSEINKNVSTKEDFESILRKEYRSETATNILDAFKKACPYARENNIALSDKRFDKLVDGLMDKCQDLTDDELAELLICIKNYPRAESPASHNFHDIWSALDDMCCTRINNWSVQKTLLFSDIWYLLGLTRFCDFSIQGIKKYCRKVDRLTATELVQSLFYINICRKQWSMFEIESRLEKVIDELTLDEMAIVSLAFFKTQTTFKGTFIMARMLEKLLENTSTVHEITLTSILKVIRYSPHVPLVDQITELYNRLIPEIDRFSTLSCVHISLLGTNIQLFHPKILTKICEKFVENISTVRLKDLERFAFTLALFDFDPKTTPNIFELILVELQRTERQTEIMKHPRCLTACIHYLGLRQIYPYELIDKIIDPEFLSKTYGNNKQSIGREILFLDASVEIDCPDYKGNKLNPKLRKNLTKWNANWIPTRDGKYRLTAADKLMLDIVDTVEIVHGKDNYLHIEYLLPHFPKPDIIICKDILGKPVEVKDYFKKYKLGDVMRPNLQNDLKWYAIVVGSWNMFIRGTDVPVGTLSTKLRQLQQLGYKSIVVPWSVFLPLTRQEKEEYIISRIT